jgi:hypothetical protein
MNRKPCVRLVAALCAWLATGCGSDSRAAMAAAGSSMTAAGTHAAVSPMQTTPSGSVPGAAERGSDTAGIAAMSGNPGAAVGGKSGSPALAGSPAEEQPGDRAAAGSSGSAGSPASGGAAAGSSGSSAGTPAMSAAGSGGASTCPPAQIAPGDTTHMLNVGSSMRSYVLHVPPSYDGSQPAPLIIDFHPLGGTGPQERRGSPYPALTDKDGVVMALRRCVGPRTVLRRGR